MDRLGHQFGAINLSGQSRAHLGDVINNYASSGSRPPLPRSLVPLQFDKDPTFVGRSEILREIQKRLSVPDRHNRIALRGLGGIGKSNVAIEYTYQHQKRRPNDWIFWVFAATRARFVESFREIAIAVGVLDAREQTADPLIVLKLWLAHPGNGSWLMVVDNLDDGNMLSEMRSHIPSCAHGSVLVTTRNEAGVDLAGGPWYALAVPELDCATSLEMLSKKLHSNVHGNKYAVALVQSLDRIPLAIAQAAAYITQNRRSIGEYLSLVRGNQQQQNAIHQRQWNDVSRDPSMSNAVFTTWMITLDRLASESPTAVDLLARLSLLDRTSIPESLVLHDGPSNTKQVDAIGTLLQYDLCCKLAGGSTYTMHRLVQLCTWAWLRENETLQSSKRNVAMLLAAKISYKRLVLPRGPTEVGYDWETFQELQPHLLVSLRCLIGQEPSHAEASICDALCEWYCMHGNYRLAAKSAFFACISSVTKLGEEHEDSLGRLVHSIHLRFLQHFFSFGFGDLWEACLKVEDALGETHPHALALQEIIMLMASPSGASRQSVLQIGNRILAGADAAFEKMSKSWVTTRTAVAATLNSIGNWREAHEIQLDLDIRTLQKVNAKHHKNLFGWFLERDGPDTERDRIKDEVAADPLRRARADPELTASMFLRMVPIELQINGLGHADTLLHRAASLLKTEKLKSQKCVKVTIEVAKAYHANGQPEKGDDLLRKMRNEYGQDVPLELDNVEELRASWEERVRSTPLIRCTDEKLYRRILHRAGMTWAMDG